MPETPDFEAAVPQPPALLRAEATQLLRSLADGDRTHLGRLFDVLHEELRNLAGHYLAQERVHHTLQPTALLNEAYLRLIEQREDWRSRGHFLGIAAQAMRRILVDHARGVNRLRRGGGWKRVELQEDLLEGKNEAFELVALDAALEKLGRHSERMARIVELRFFGGLEVEDVAKALDISPRTVKREWRFARAWLSEELGKST